MKIYQGPLRRYETSQDYCGDSYWADDHPNMFFCAGGGRERWQVCIRVYICAQNMQPIMRFASNHLVRCSWSTTVQSIAPLNWLPHCPYLLLVIYTQCIIVLWDIPFSNLQQNHTKPIDDIRKTTWWKIATWCPMVTRQHPPCDGHVFYEDPHLPISPSIFPGNGHLSAEVSSFKFEATAATQISTRPCQRVRSKSHSQSNQVHSNSSPNFTNLEPAWKPEKVWNTQGILCFFHAHWGWCSAGRSNSQKPSKQRVRWVRCACFYLQGWSTSPQNAAKGFWYSVIIWWHSGSDRFYAKNLQRPPWHLDLVTVRCLKWMKECHWNRVNGCRVFREKCVRQEMGEHQIIRRYTVDLYIYIQYIKIYPIVSIHYPFTHIL